jgi:SAM-dependent methyltransferase
MSTRERLASAVDAVTLRIATRKYLLFGPVTTYQNLPWCGITGARRASGSAARLQAMQRYLAENGKRASQVLDIGCNVGFFSLSFAEAGSVAYGVEMSPLNLRVATISSRRIKSRGGRFIPICMECSPDTVTSLPRADVTVCLSIWHHWVRHQGVTSATTCLRELWKRTDQVLFFDSGELEMPDYYGLPYQDEEPRAWLIRYLSDNLSGSIVDELGRFPAFGPKGNEASSSVERSLFAVRRTV